MEIHARIICQMEDEHTAVQSELLSCVLNIYLHICAEQLLLIIMQRRVMQS